MTEKEILQKSEVMKKERENFLINFVNPHEEKNKTFIQELINFYDIQSLSDWYRYEYLIPDCSTKLMYTIHYQKANKK